MRARYLLVLAVAVIVPAAEANAPIDLEAQVVGSRVSHPSRVIKQKREFTPDDKPSPAKAQWILRKEYQKYGGIYAGNRVYCESNWQWNAENGQYKGLAQAEAYIWGYMYETTPRKVVLFDRHKRWHPKYRTDFYSDGTKKRYRVGRVRQLVKVRRIGFLPDNASPFHGWAALRVVQRATPGGGGRTTSWSCSL